MHGNAGRFSRCWRTRIVAWIGDSCCRYFQSNNWLFFRCCSFVPFCDTATNVKQSKREREEKRNKKRRTKKGQLQSVKQLLRERKNYNWFFLFLRRINFLQELLLCIALILPLIPSIEKFLPAKTKTIETAMEWNKKTFKKKTYKCITGRKKSHIISRHWSIEEWKG